MTPVFYIGSLSKYMLDSPKVLHVSLNVYLSTLNQGSRRQPCLWAASGEGFLAPVRERSCSDNSAVLRMCDPCEAADLMLSSSSPPNPIHCHSSGAILPSIHFSGSKDQSMEVLWKNYLCPSFMVFWLHGQSFYSRHDHHAKMAETDGFQCQVHSVLWLE